MDFARCSDVVEYLFMTHRSTSIFLLGAVEDNGCSGRGSAWRGGEESGGRKTSSESSD